MAHKKKRITRPRKVAIVYECSFKCGHTEQCTVEVPVTKGGLARMKKTAARWATQSCFYCGY